MASMGEFLGENHCCQETQRLVSLLPTKQNKKQHLDEPFGKTFRRLTIKKWNFQEGGHQFVSSNSDAVGSRSRTTIWNTPASPPPNNWRKKKVKVLEQLRQSLDLNPINMLFCDKNLQYGRVKINLVDVEEQNSSAATSKTQHQLSQTLDFNYCC